MEIERFDDADKFIAKLLDGHIPAVRKYAYRGHKCSSWELRPSLNRFFCDSESRPRFAPPDLKSIPVPANTTNQEHWKSMWHMISLEDQMIRVFVSEADSCGLQTPWRDLNGWRRFFRDGISSFAELAPDESTAFAQHAGVPTRLLDWTWNPLAAAYFVVRSSTRKDNNTSVAETSNSNKSDYAAVCRLEVSQINSFTPLSKTPRVELLQYPTSLHPNIRAQGGLFTWDSQAEDKYVATGKYPTLDRAVDTNHALSKFEIKKKKIDDLRIILDRYNMNERHLFPTLAAVADHIKERQFPK